MRAFFVCVDLSQVFPGTRESRVKLLALINFETNYPYIFLINILCLYLLITKTKQL